MSDQEIKVAGQTTINVVMKDDVAALDEVIVVGYGTAKKQSLTGAVSAVKGDELLKAPATNVSSLLGGRLPGISSVIVPLVVPFTTTLTPGSGSPIPSVTVPFTKLCA